MKSKAQASKSNIEQVMEAKGATGARHMGDVVWLSMSGVEAKRADIRAAFAQQGLPEALAPADPSAEAAFGMAVGAYGSGSEHGIFLRRVDTKHKGSDVLLLHTRKGIGALDDVQTIGRVGVTLAGKIAVTQNAALWDFKADQAVRELTNTFDNRMEHATSSELGGAVVAAVLSWCGGIRLRDRGNVYWAHSAGAQEVRSLARVLEQFGTSYLAVLPVHDNTEARGTVQRAAAESFACELRDISEELAKFSKSSTLRTSTLERRLEEYEDLAQRVDLYSDILSLKRNDILGALEKAKETVRQMLASTDLADE
jgi:hypothetical protein